MNTPTPAAAAPPAQGGAAAVLPDNDATKLSGRRAALLISTLLLGVLSFQLNASMVTPALPQIAASFGESADSAAPVQSMFFLAGAIAGPVIGRWSDSSAGAPRCCWSWASWAPAPSSASPRPPCRCSSPAGSCRASPAPCSRSPTSCSARTCRPKFSALPWVSSPPSTGEWAAWTATRAGSWPRPSASGPSSSSCSSSPPSPLSASSAWCPPGAPLGCAAPWTGGVPAPSRCSWCS
ncbi:hypothetical protein ARTHRO9AX_80207 [Arthrobacter sp. 9AX]|nr:hypothetical protein ARTHRO9AX_80207 [Arthrobacter sp. 9AX]